MELSAILEKMGMAVLLGALVGLERQKDHPRLAGLRTFPFITLLGTLCGLLSQTLGNLIVAVGFLSITTLTVVGNWLSVRKGDLGSGITTEVAILLMFGVGVYLTIGSPVVCIVASGAIAVLLQFKPELHQFARKLNDKDIRAIMRLVLIAAIILPVIPNKTLGSFEILNPFEIWRMVVIVVAVNLLGYLLHRFFGEKAGTLLAGVLGGIISSTATTLAESKLAKKNPHHSAHAAVVILIATSVMYLRVLILVSVIAPNLLQRAAVPLGIMAAISLGTSLVALLLARKSRETKAPVTDNPGEFKAALFFAALYAVIGVGLTLANRYLGSGSLLWVAGISGFTDVDAITLSTSELVKAGNVDVTLGWKMILIASLSNMLFKGVVVAVVGSRELLYKIAALFAVSLGAGILLLVLG